MTVDRSNITFAFLILFIIIGGGLALGALLSPALQSPPHNYGEPVGRVAEPANGECVLDGRYYPVSSGKCTVILPPGGLVAGGGMGGKVSLPFGNESVCTIPDTNNPGGGWLMPCKEAEKYSGVALKDGVSTLVKKEEYKNYTVTTFSGSGFETWTVPEGATCIDYLIVDGLDIGGEIISGCTNSTISGGFGGGSGGSEASSTPTPEIPLFSEPAGIGGGGGIETSENQFAICVYAMLPE